MKYAIQLIGAPVVLGSGQPGALWEGQFLSAYNPDAFDGGGDATWVKDIARAMHFDSFIEAIEEWKRPSKVKPLRTDGKVNRPLTACTITVVPVPEGSA